MNIDFNTLCTQAVARGVFASVQRTPEGIECAALDAAAPASYSLTLEAGRCMVRLKTADRWLSESIETDLLHTGDAVEELIAEELIDLGGDVGELKTKHFRNDAREYVFENELGAIDTRAALLHLLAYEAAFRQLGDMSGDGGE